MDIMNDDTIGRILAFLGFVWFFGIIIVAIGSSNSKHTTCLHAGCDNEARSHSSYCFLHDSSSRHTYSSDSSNTTSSETSSDSSYTAHLSEAHPHLLRRRRIPHRRVRLIMKMPAVLILMDTMTLTCNRTMTKTDTRKTAIMPKVSMMRWMMLITNMEKSIK